MDEERRVRKNTLTKTTLNDDLKKNILWQKMINVYYSKRMRIWRPGCGARPQSTFGSIQVESGRLTISIAGCDEDLIKRTYGTQSLHHFSRHINRLFLIPRGSLIMTSHGASPCVVLSAALPAVLSCIRADVNFSIHNHMKFKSW